MKIFLADQKNKFKTHLDVLKKSLVMEYNKTLLKAKTTRIILNTEKRLTDLDLGFFFEYKIFPEHILTYLTQWESEKRKMKIGDTIVQQVYLPPNRIFSQKIIFGVRIKEVIDLPGKKAFSYETLNGHVEKGISKFTIEEIDNKLAFCIETISGSGNLLAQLLGPIFSIPYQNFCTGKAIENVRKQIECQ